MIYRDEEAARGDTGMIYRDEEAARGDTGMIYRDSDARCAQWTVMLMGQ